MNSPLPIHSRLTLKNFFFASLLAHFVLLVIFSANGHYEFSRPITGGEIVSVALDSIDSAAKQTVPLPNAPLPEPVRGEPGFAAPSARETFALPAVMASPPPPVSQSVLPPTVADAPNISAATPPLPPPTQPQAEAKPSPQVLTPSLRPKLPQISPPLRTAGEFLQVRAEKLTYRLSMFGMPMGSASLEARNLSGEVNIALKVKSNPALAAVFPVDDQIETRHVAGNFIISKINQHEGAYQSKRGFTIFLRDKYVFWIDLKTNGSTREPLPNAEVVDILSGLYYLRNQPLEVGGAVTLHVYDSDAYAEMPVEVVRREQLQRPVGGVTTALVVRPRHSSAGLFRNAGEMLIWLSDDDNRVPLRIEAAIPIGRLTAELVAAEVERNEPAALAGVSVSLLRGEVVP